jgi:hypothetical protein
MYVSKHGDTKIAAGDGASYYSGTLYFKTILQVAILSFPGDFV